jgi:putative RNA 2'-phosphotransferase
MHGVYLCSVCGRHVEEESHCGRPAVAALDGATRLRISKLLSLALRHDPTALGVKVDKEGWADVDAVLKGLEKAGLGIDAAVLRALAELDDKGRFELQNGKIRARYGHSIDVSISYPEDATSAALYHGTSLDYLPAMLREGILPMKRRYVHLAVDVETACLNAARRPRPVVLAVDAQCLRRRGYRVYIASHKIRLVQYVPPECVEKKVTNY